MLFEKGSNGFHRHTLGHHHNKGLKQQRKSAPRTSPGNIDGLDTTISTIASRNTRAQIGLVLEKIQMPPCPPLRVVRMASLSAATRTGKNTASGKINLDVQTMFVRTKLTRNHLPRRSQTQSQLKKICVSHPDPYQPPPSLDDGSLSCCKQYYPYFSARSLTYDSLGRWYVGCSLASVLFYPPVKIILSCSPA